MTSRESVTGEQQEERYSRVTILDRATLFVTGSKGDFASTVLEEIVQEHVPAYTHNPPTLILLEDVAGFDLEKPSPLAADLFKVLRDHMYGGPS